MSQNTAILLRKILLLICLGAVLLSAIFIISSRIIHNQSWLPSQRASETSQNTGTPLSITTLTVTVAVQATPTIMRTSPLGPSRVPPTIQPTPTTVYSEPEFADCTIIDLAEPQNQAWIPGGLLVTYNIFPYVLNTDVAILGSRAEEIRYFDSSDPSVIGPRYKDFDISPDYQFLTYVYENEESASLIIEDSAGNLIERFEMPPSRPEDIGDPLGSRIGFWYGPAWVGSETVVMTVYSYEEEQVVFLSPATSRIQEETLNLPFSSFIPEFYTLSAFWETYSIFSPDRSKAVYLGSPDDQFSYILYDTQQGEILRTFPVVENYQFTPPSWSPDGQWLALRVTPPGSEHFTLHILDQNGTTVLQIADTGSQYVGSLQWSADSKHLLMWQDNGADVLSILQLNLEDQSIDQYCLLDTHPINIRLVASGQAELSWSPDSNFIALQLGNKIVVIDLRQNIVAAQIPELRLLGWLDQK